MPVRVDRLPDGSVELTGLDRFLVDVLQEIPERLDGDQPEQGSRRLYPAPSEDLEETREWERLVHPDLFALLAEARVCVCPSEKEGWGLTVIESNAAGTPVVATDADGLRDSVRDGETGYLVPSGDVDGFDRRIGDLLADDGLSASMASAALAWSKQFDWDKAGHDMAAAIEETRSRA